MLLKKALIFLILTIGSLFISFSALPAFLPYPYSNKSASGPANVVELILMMSYEQWKVYLIFGLVLLICSFILLLRMRTINRTKG